MSRWWRAYDEAVDDPKLQRLGPKLGWTWFNLMCIASANDGALPPIGDVAFKLRTTEQQAAASLAALVSAGLFDRQEDGSLAPHNWSSRQYKSDRDPTAAERKRRQRDRDRDKPDVTRDITHESRATSRPPETEQRQIQKKDAASAASVDPEVDLFRRGKDVLGNNAGGLIKQLLTAKGGKVTDARAAIETAAGKQNPREYINGVIRKKNQGDEPQWLDGIPGVI